MNFISFLQEHYSLFGCRGIWLAAGARVRTRNTQVSVTIPGIRHPVWLRLRTSDTSCFRQVLMTSGYDYDFRHPIRSIVDAGAYIGLSSVFYANKYPDATIVAIEPEASNYEMLEKNVAPYPNIIPLRRALWKNSERLNLKSQGSGNWAFQSEVANISATDIPSSDSTSGITLDTVMKQYGFDQIDLLKIDIEGSEKEIFSNATNWIDRVGAIAIELHEYLAPGCKEAFDVATKDFATVCVRGETVFVEKMSETVGPSCSTNVTISDPLPSIGRCQIVQAIRS